MDKIKDFLIYALLYAILIGFILFVLTLVVFYIARVFCFSLDIPMNRNYVFAVEGCIILLVAWFLRAVSK